MLDGNETPQTPSETTPAAPVAEVAEHVEEAATNATQVAEATGEDGWKVVAEELKGLRGDIKKLVENTTQATTQAAAPATSESTPPAPDVKVEVPTPPERQIRRGGRKVARRG